MKIKEATIAIFFILATIVISIFFPVRNDFQRFLSTFIFFIILPIIFNKFFLKKEFIKLGITIGDYKSALLISLYNLLAIGLIFFIISYYFNFLNIYTIPVFIVNDFLKFVLYEFFMVLVFVFIYEFYFRGFVLAVFREKIGYWVILLQTVLFIAAAFIGNKVSVVNLLPYLIVTPFAGFIAYRTRSILYSGLVQFLVIFILNLIVIKKIS